MQDLLHIMLKTLDASGGYVPTLGRMNKNIFLADWLHALATGKQMSDLKWIRDQRGPFLHRIDDEARRHSRLIKRNERQDQNHRIVSFSLEPEGRNFIGEIDRSSQDAITVAVDTLKPRRWQDVLEFIYAIPAVDAATQGAYIDIEGAAARIRQSQIDDFIEQDLPKFAPLLKALGRS